MVKLYNDDCFNVFPQIDDNSIDCIICDPPYGTTPLKWDNILPFEDLWKQYKRIIKVNGAIVIFSQEPFATYLRMSNIKDYRYDWYWEKERLTNVFQIKKRCGKTVENIVVFYNQQCTYNAQKIQHTGKKVTNKIGENARWSITQAGYKSITKPFEYNDDGTRYPTQILRINRENPRKRVHPTQKPVELLMYLVKTYTNEGDMVLDNCMGSGSTGIACKLLNRDFIGIEIDETYFNIAQERIENCGKNKLFY